MNLFNKKPKNNLLVLQPGDILLNNGKPYLITTAELRELPVKKVGDK